MEDKTKKLARIINFSMLGVLAIFIIASVATSMYTVSEQETAVVTQFGKAIGESGAGLHFKIPFMQQVYTVNMTTRGMELGYKSQGTHDSMTNVSVETESFMITRDFNFVNIDFYVEWKVSNATKYLFRSSDPEGLLRNILQSEARSAVSMYDVDDVLTTAKSEIQTRMKEEVLAKLDAYDIGIVVTNISIQDAEPPTAQVISAFKDVENAKQNKDTEINIANTYNNEIIPSARAEADKIIREAEGEKEARISEAKGQVARFNEMYAEYVNNKEITKTRIYLETMESVLPGVKVYIQSGGQEDILKIMDIAPDEGNQPVNNGVNGGNE